MSNGIHVILSQCQVLFCVKVWFEWNKRVWKSLHVRSRPPSVPRAQTRGLIRKTSWQQSYHVCQEEPKPHGTPQVEFWLSTFRYSAMFETKKTCNLQLFGWVGKHLFGELLQWHDEAASTEKQLSESIPSVVISGAMQVRSKEVARMTPVRGTKLMGSN